VDLDQRLFRIRLSRFTGIDWGTDLSFRFVYVRGIDPNGSAARAVATGTSGQKIKVNDQLCEVQPVVLQQQQQQQQQQNIAASINVIGAPFDYVMNQFSQLDPSITDVDLVFFRGTREELQLLCGTGEDSTPSTSLLNNSRKNTTAAASTPSSSSSSSSLITVSVVENKGSNIEKLHTFTAPPGVNVRKLCVDHGINVYQSVSRWTNCKGKQLCGTCIVNIPNGQGTNRKSVDEESTLRENPETYRLACITFAYQDVTVETFPPIKAAQWTR
jgi:ferredoxin